MRKIIILTTSLLLVSSGINATDTLNKLVETKIEQAPVMEAPRPINPTKVAGLTIKLVIKAFKESVGLTRRLSFEEFTKLSIISLVKTDSLKEVSFIKGLGYALFKEMNEAGLQVSRGLRARTVGYRMNDLFKKLGYDIVKTRQNLENLYFLTKDNVQYEKALSIMKDNPKIKLDELAGQVRAEIIAENGNKTINLGFNNKSITNPVNKN